MSARLVRIQDIYGDGWWFDLAHVRLVQEPAVSLEWSTNPTTTGAERVETVALSVLFAGVPEKMQMWVSPATRDWLLSAWTTWTDVTSPPT